MLTLFPYLLRSTWVFDDVRTGLKEEVFVLGMTEMISRLVETKGIPNATKGFALSFSDQPFDGYDAELKWLSSDESQVVPDQDGNASAPAGNWYRGLIAGEEMAGWRWGRLHRVRWPHALGERPGLKRLSVGPFGTGGGVSLVRSASHGDRPPFAVTGGSTYRLVVDLGDPTQALSVSPTGQSVVRMVPSRRR